MNGIPVVHPTNSIFKDSMGWGGARSRVPFVGRLKREPKGKPPERGLPYFETTLVGRVFFDRVTKRTSNLLAVSIQTANLGASKQGNLFEGTSFCGLKGKRKGKQPFLEDPLKKTHPCLRPCLDWLKGRPKTKQPILGFPYFERPHL